jgi:hypothetical protein
MTFERHRILSAHFIEAVEEADAERTDRMGRVLFFWLRWFAGTMRSESVIRRLATAPTSLPNRREAKRRSLR